MRPSRSPQELERQQFRGRALLQRDMARPKWPVARASERDGGRRWKAALHHQWHLGRSLDSRSPATIERQGSTPTGKRSVARRTSRRFRDPPVDLSRVGPVIGSPLSRAGSPRSRRSSPARTCLGVPKERQPRAIERDEEAIRRWIRHTWLAVKKSLAPEILTRLSR
jgi:hypothetical protein